MGSTGPPNLFLAYAEIETTSMTGYFQQDYLSIFLHLSYDSAEKTQSAALLQFSSP